VVCHHLNILLGSLWDKLSTSGLGYSLDGVLAEIYLTATSSIQDGHHIFCDYLSLLFMKPSIIFHTCKNTHCHKIKNKNKNDKLLPITLFYF
jgi:hypothetical protein